MPEVVPALPREVNWNRNLPVSAPVDWLRRGWSDLSTTPHVSLAYGLIVFLISAALVGALFSFQADYILFPAIAGFMITGPAFAIGLYQKSRRISQGLGVTLANTLPGWNRAGGQVAFIGVILVLLILLWMRAAVLIYALFFGMLPFEGLSSVAGTLATAPGIALLLVGGFVGGLFAAFSFAISVFSIPMLLAEDTDAFTAMGTSIALVWGNLKVMLVWGAIVLALFVLSCLTGFVALVVIFPLLGHATWHAYQATQPTGQSEASQ